MPPAGDDHGIEIRLDELLTHRGVTLSALAQQVGITVANLSILKNGHAKVIRLSTLGALCETLRCQPGDLMRHHPAARPAPRG